LYSLYRIKWKNVPGWRTGKGVECKSSGPLLKYSNFCLEDLRKYTKEIRSVGIQTKFRTLPGCCLQHRNIHFLTISYLLSINLNVAKKWNGKHLYSTAVHPNYYVMKLHLSFSFSWNIARRYWIFVARLLGTVLWSHPRVQCQFIINRTATEAWNVGTVTELRIMYIEFEIQQSKTYLKIKKKDKFRIVGLQALYT